MRLEGGENEEEREEMTESAERDRVEQDWSKSGARVEQVEHDSERAEWRLSAAELQASRQAISARKAPTPTQSRSTTRASQPLGRSASAVGASSFGPGSPRVARRSSGLTHSRVQWALAGAIFTRNTGSKPESPAAKTAGERERERESACRVERRGERGKPAQGRRGADHTKGSTG